MRKQIAAGNWKMNLLADEAYALARRIEKYAITNTIGTGREIILAPPAPYLETIADIMHFSPQISVAAQNCSEHLSGAYTGEVSAGMLKSIGVKYVIIGHSERRQYHGEDHSTLRKKVERVIKNEMRPIFCCGEPEEIRRKAEHKAYVSNQLEESLLCFTADEVRTCVIAYEPVWAIGTGQTATSKQAQEMHHFIRSLIAEHYSEDVADDISILYGGSCNPGNAQELFSNKDVDGGLIGGASLKADQFIEIIQALT